MNEVEIIRAQLAAEREHLREVAALFSTLSGNYSQDFIMSYTDYLLFGVRQERARSAALLDHSRGASDRAPDRALRTGDELSALEAALQEVRAAAGGHPTGAHSAAGAHSTAAARSELPRELGRCTSLLERLIESRLSLQAPAERSFTVDNWRRLAHVDADSILEERRLRAEVLRHGARAASP